MNMGKKFSNLGLRYLSRIKKSFIAYQPFLSGNMLEYSLVLVAFFLLTLLYTDNVLIGGDHRLFIEGPGDGTAGFLWLNFASNQNGGFLGYTNFINYPVGDNLTNPTYITYATQLIPLILLSKIVGPVMSLNIVTYVGFLSCAVGVYWFTKRLFLNSGIAFFAGYAAAFVPYHIMNSSSHLSYIFSSVFVAIAASFYGVITKPTTKRSLLLGIVLAFAFYTDGYFILLASVFLATLALAAAVYGMIIVRQNKLKIFTKRIKHLLLSFVALCLLLLPMVYVQVNNAKKIETNLAQSRGMIRDEAQFYATRFMDYIIPSVHNPLLKNNQDFINIQKYKNSRSNAMENSLYIGFTLLILISVACSCVVGFLVLKKNSLLYKIPEKERSIVIAITVCGLVMLPLLALWMTGPTITIFGRSITSPAGFLINHGVALWRVYSRMFLPLHIIVVIMAAAGLRCLYWYMRGTLKGYLFYIVLGFLFVTLGLEYASDTSRPAYNFLNTPKAYYWLKDQRDIYIVAELPFVDRPLETNYNYVTAQLVHQKRLVNSHMSTSEIGIHTALGDISNPESVDYAIRRGAQAIITHGTICRKDVNWGVLAYEDKNLANSKESIYYEQPVCVYRVNESRNLPDPYFLSLKKGTFADRPVVKNNQSYSIVYGKDATISVRDSNGKAVIGFGRLKLKTNLSPDAVVRGGSWVVRQGQNILQEGTVGEYVDVPVDASQDIEIIFTYPEKHSELYQYAISEASITKE